MDSLSAIVLAYFGWRGRPPNEPPIDGLSAAGWL
jgi:hypothetical protein